MNKFKFLILALVVLTLGMLGYFAFTKIPSIIQPGPLEEVTVQFGWLNNPQFAGFYVAKEKGFYRDAGLNVTFKEYKEGVAQIDDLENWKIDFGVSTPVEILPAIQSGKHIKAIAA